MGQILHFIRPDTIAFDDHATHAMGEAFDAACAELQDNHLSELVREMIAERIIDAATRGERDPKRLCKIGIAGINSGGVFPGSLLASIYCRSFRSRL